jgi:hypothetical protein
MMPPKNPTPVRLPINVVVLTATNSTTTESRYTYTRTKMTSIFQPCTTSSIFLYTGCVNLNFEPCKEAIDRYEFPPGFPVPDYPLLLYKNAKKFLIDDLAKYTLEVLKKTLTPENVGERLFRGHDDLRFCDELVDLYVDYLVSNYEDVKALEEWQTMEWDPECEDEIAKFRWSLMLRIMGQLTVPAETT